METTQNLIETKGNQIAWKLISEVTVDDVCTETQAMEVHNVGVVLRVSTKAKNGLAEALTFIPSAKIKSTYDAVLEIVQDNSSLEALANWKKNYN